MHRSNRLCDEDDQKFSLSPPRHLDIKTNNDDAAAHCPWQKKTLAPRVNVEARVGSHPNNSTPHPPIIFTRNCDDEASSFASLAECSPHQLPHMDSIDEKAYYAKRHAQKKVDAVVDPYTGTATSHHEFDDDGAVQERGCSPSSAASSTSASSVSWDDTLPEAAIVAEVVTTVDAQVVREADLVYQFEEQFRHRADEIAQQVVRQLQGARDNNAGGDESLGVNKTTTPTDGDGTAKLWKRKRLFWLIGGCLVAAIMAAVLVVVLVLVIQPQPSPKLQPTPAPTTPAPKTIIPTTIPPQPSNICADFPCTSNLTALELVNAAPNHTLLVEYFTRVFNWDLRDYISSDLNPLTLLAPTDESFRALQPPFSLYIDDDRWKLHLWFLLGTHIISQQDNASAIIQAVELPTFWPTFVLAVNHTDLTIDNDVSIVTADIEASNGYIQIPNRVLINHNLRLTLREYFVSTKYTFSNRLSKFRGLLLASGLDSKLEQLLETGLTLFAPSDVAFDELPANISSMLFEAANSTFTADVILYHIVDVNINNLAPRRQYAFTMLNDVSAWFTSNDPSNVTFVNSVPLSEYYTVKNGFLHIIDHLLLPPNMGELLQISTEVTTGFNVTTFLSIVRDHALLGDLFTGVVKGHPNLVVFAPIESAFAEIMSDPSLLSRMLEPGWLLHLQSLCRHHFTWDSFSDIVGQRQLAMLSGFESTYEQVSIGSQITDINGTIDGANFVIIPGSTDALLYVPNGLVRFIDKVLLPPWVNQSAFGMLSQNQDFSSFLQLVQVSNLKNIFSGTDGPFTILAPSNEAIAALTGNYSEQELVLRHVLWGNVYIPFAGHSALSLANETLSVQTVGNKTTIGGATIIQANVLMSNGVIHVIDRALL